MFKLLPQLLLQLFNIKLSRTMSRGRVHPHTMDSNDTLLWLRPTSQIFKLHVVPEVEKRIASGTIKEAELPYRISRFRLLQSQGVNVVEINDEVAISVITKSTRPVEMGEAVTLADIQPDETYLTAPLLNGKPAAFFLTQSSFMNFMSIFDFTPNAPGWKADDSPHSQFKYPVTELVHTKQMLDMIQPVQQYVALASANWPPGPAFYPNVLRHLHETPNAHQGKDFSDVVASAYSQAYLVHQLELWEKTQFFRDRFIYVKKAIDEYFAGDFMASIYVLVPHFEGIVRDYLGAAGTGTSPYRFESCVKALKDLVLSRRVLLFPREVLDVVFSFIETGTFLAETSTIANPSQEVTRHGIAHGKFVGFENRDIALKYLILLDALAYVILHDKMVLGSI